MADVIEQQGDHPHGSVYRVAGALTITRAATTQREVDALPDPLTIDTIQATSPCSGMIIPLTIQGIAAGMGATITIINDSLKDFSIAGQWRCPDCTRRLEIFHADFVFGFRNLVVTRTAHFSQRGGDYVRSYSSLHRPVRRYRGRADRLGWIRRGQDPVQSAQECA